MKKLVQLISFCILLLFNPTVVIAAPIKLLCNGWMPMYDSIGRPFNLAPAAGKGTDITVTIDTSNRTMTLSLPYASTKVVPLNPKNIENSYWGHVPSEMISGDLHFKSFLVQIDRNTGKIFSMYFFEQTSQGGGKIAFDGYCSVAKTKF